MMVLSNIDFDLLLVPIANFIDKIDGREDRLSRTNWRKDWFGSILALQIGSISADRRTSVIASSLPSPGSISTARLGSIGALRPTTLAWFLGLAGGGSICASVWFSSIGAGWFASIIALLSLRGGSVSAGWCSSIGAGRLAPVSTNPFPSSFAFSSFPSSNSHDCKHQQTEYQRKLFHPVVG